MNSPAELAAKRDRLLELLRSYGSCAVAFSGGLDSTVLAKAAQLALGDRGGGRHRRQRQPGRRRVGRVPRLARQIGIRHEVIQTEELSIPEYQKNTPRSLLLLQDASCSCEVEQAGRAAGRGGGGRRLQPRRPRRASPRASRRRRARRSAARWPSAA